MDDLEKGSTSDQRIDVGHHMPGTEIRVPAHRHRSAGAHLTHRLDNESPPGPRRPPESSPSSPGRSSSASDHRASRLSAALSRAGSVTCYAAGFLVAVAALLALPLQAQAQTVQTLVSNTGQSLSSFSYAVQSGNWVQAQGFTTGDNADGYTLSTVQVHISSIQSVNSEARVSIYEPDASGNPGTSLYVLTNSGSLANNSLITFAAPANAALVKETSYLVVLEATGDRYVVSSTASDVEDAGKASGWSINSVRHSKGSGDWFTHTNVLSVAIEGTVNGTTTLSTDATLTDLALSGVTLAPTFASATEDYTATVVNAVMQTTVTATPTHSGATVAFKDGDDNALTSPVTLAVGANVIKAVVTAEDTTTMKTYMVTVTRALPAVTIEAEYESIGGGLEDLDFTLTREGETTDALAVKVTITQAQTWLGNSDLEHDVTFLADSATAELTITRSKFSFTPSTAGDLTATVVGDGIDGGSDTVEIISTSEAPITISYDMPEYTFAEDATDEAVYEMATLNAAYPRPPSFTFEAASFSSRGNTATSPEDYLAISDHRRFSPGDFERDVDTDPFVARVLIQDFIVPDDIYEGSEHFVLWIEAAPGVSADLVQFAYPNGTTCAPINCSPTPEYEVTITDEGDLPVLSLSVDPSSIAEEDDDGTTSTAENVSTVTVGITNGKTFAVDQTATLTFSGTATQGTHYSVSPGDADTNTAGHQVVLPKETASVEVTVTATGNDTDDGPRTVTVAGDLDGTAIGSRGITILDDDTTTPTTVPGAPTSLTATANGTTTINLSWTAPADNGGSPITGYRIEVSPNGTSSWTNRVANTGTTTTTYAHTGLSAGTTRYYRVSAINANGTGAASNTDNATTDDDRHHRVRRPDQPHGNGQRDDHDQPLVDRAGRRRRLRHHRLQDRGFAQWHLELDQPRRRHRHHHHHLRPHRPFRRHHPLLPRLGHQRQRHRRRLQHRQRHHRRRRHHRARRPDQPHGNGQRDDHDQPLVDRAGRRRRLRHHRLQDRGFAQWHLELDQPRRRHRHHHHHLRPHRPFRRHHPPLPRLRHQRQRHRRRLQHRQRHHRHHHRHGAADADR